ncbi:MAG: dTDP-4-dehydrorhamnose reductase [Proteobacteria bacterium]|nr:dTDP-4-dehydrorhamnose reductase [Pseudomonadota bacterium]
MKQTVLVTGAGGQLGRELVLGASSEIDCIAVDREALNICNPVAIREFLRKVQPQLLINAAAYTAVDKAESESGAAWKANALAPGYLAEACADLGVRLIHVSTDFVFDGEASQPYLPNAATSPVSEYGRGKLAGELAVQKALPEALIVRTSWVYSRFGANFVKTMLRLMSERQELGVVSDQLGTPTWARGLAQALWAAGQRPHLHGIYHWSDDGVCSWHDFAVAIYEECRSAGLLDSDVEIKPIPGSSYPTPAHRPAYSVLDKTSSWRDFEVRGVAWREQLRTMLLDMQDSKNEGTD